MVANAKPDFYHDGTLKLMSIWDKFIHVLGENSKKKWQFTGIKRKNLTVDIVNNIRYGDGLFVLFDCKHSSDESP
jgi:hypothetical protein